MNNSSHFIESRPLNALSVAPSVFSLECLEFSFELLRHCHPSLALTVQNLMASYRPAHNSAPQDKTIAIELDVQLVSDIVICLSEIAESAASNEEIGKEEKIKIHQSLLDWLIYAQSFMDEVQPLPK